MRRLGWVVLATVVAVAGCGGSDPCAGQTGSCISATVEGSVPNIDQLRITIDKATGSQLTPSPAHAVPMPVQFAIVLPSTVTGQATVQVQIDGLRGGTEIAHAAQPVTLSPSGRAHATFVLQSASAPPVMNDDMAMPSGLSVSAAAATGRELETLTVPITLTKASANAMLKGDSTLPTGASFTQPVAGAGGALTWTPDITQGGATYAVNIIVSDGTQSAMTTVMLTIANSIDPAPALAPGDMPSSGLPVNIIGDFNGDHFADLASCSVSAAGVYEVDVLYGSAAGLPTTTPTPAQRQAYTFNYNATTANTRLRCIGADLDGDLHSDVIIADPQSGTNGQLFVLFGVDRTVTTATWVPMMQSGVLGANEIIGTNALLAGDFTGDGVVDLATQTRPSASTDNIFVFPGVKPRNLGTFYTTTSPLITKALGTNNGCPQRQLKAIGSRNGTTQELLLADPSVGSTSSTTCPAGGGVTFVGATATTSYTAMGTQAGNFALHSTLCDVDGDGKSDLVTIDDSSGVASVYYAPLPLSGMALDSTMASLVMPASGHPFNLLGCAPGWFAGSSLFLAATTPVPVSVSLVDGTTKPPTVTATLPNPTSPADSHFGESFGASGDVNNDGKLDLLVGTLMGNYWVVYGR